METTNFLAWLTCVTLVGGFGLGTMIWAYKGSGSTAILFPQPVAVPPSLLPVELKNTFERASSAYTSGDFQAAAEEFSRVIQSAPTLAQAYHNRGLAFANLRQDNEAASNLARAGEIYAQHENSAGIEAVKQNLMTLKAR
ncbi:MAG: hypothetical protein ACFB4I_06880 [Cyanophyceae cyanobacterium]